MFLRILKNDLKRKRVTNAILLIFISLAAMFVSSSVNTMITIATAQDSYFEKANVCDYYAMEAYSTEGFRLASKAERFDSVKSLHKETLLYIFNKNVDCDINDVFIVVTQESSSTVFFNDDNTPLEKVDSGEMYIPQKMIDNGMFKMGQSIRISIGGTSVSLKVTGIIKDALFGSQFMGENRAVISERDMQRLCSESEGDLAKAELISINTDNEAQLATDIMNTNIRTDAQFTKSTVKMTFIMDIIIAAMFFLISVCLILISFVVLNFTIKFTLGQEFREIGVMKAIGIQDEATENMYLAKYIFLSAIGGVIGFFAGIPFGDVMKQTSSKNVVIDSKNLYGINILCVVIVISVVVFFCRRCVKSLRKYTPVDAVRNGSSGESYSKKSLISLSRSRLSPKVFLALNDILTNAKTFAVMAFTFVVCMIWMIAVVNTVNTMSSDSIVTLMGFARSDIYMVQNDEFSDYKKENGHDMVLKRNAEIESVLRRNNMSGRAFVDMGFYMDFKNGERKVSVIARQGVGIKADEFVYTEGTAPQNENEIAVTAITANRLNVNIGDTVIMKDDSGEREMLVTALFQTMFNMGEGVRLHEDADIDYTQVSSGGAFQVKFEDELSQKELDERIERVKELFPKHDVMGGSDYIESLIHLTGTLESVEKLLLPILLIVCVMVTVLIERSLMAKEKSETAMLKATGFSNGFVIGRDMLRVVFVTVISTVIAILLSEPVSQITCGTAFKIAGAQSVEFVIKPLEVYVIYPLIMLSATLAAVWLTALGTRGITANQTAGIE